MVKKSPPTAIKQDAIPTLVENMKLAKKRTNAKNRLTINESSTPWNILPNSNVNKLLGELKIVLYSVLAFSWRSTRPIIKAKYKLKYKKAAQLQAAYNIIT